MGFEDLAWLFRCDHRNRGILRLDFDEAAVLWRAVRATRGDILEIGRLLGGSTVLLAEASREGPDRAPGGLGSGRRIVSLDIAPRHRPECEAYFAREGVRERLDLRIANAHLPIASDERFGMCFIDGDHSYEGVRADTCAHWDRIDTGDGLVVFHDAIPNDGLDFKNDGTLAHAPGVLRWCEELLATGCAEEVERGGSMLCVRKTRELPAALVEEAIAVWRE